MIKLVESVNYEIYKEYEIVFLKIKSSDKRIPIGDFYGDVELLFISWKNHMFHMNMKKLRINGKSGIGMEECG